MRFVSRIIANKGCPEIWKKKNRERTKKRFLQLSIRLGHTCVTDAHRWICNRFFIISIRNILNTPDLRISIEWNRFSIQLLGFIRHDIPRIRFSFYIVNESYVFRFMFSFFFLPFIVRDGSCNAKNITEYKKIFKKKKDSRFHRRKGHLINKCEVCKVSWKICISWDLGI